MRPGHRIRRLAAHVNAVSVAGVRDELLPLAADIDLTDADMKAMKQKYALERDKRLNARPEGSAQWKDLCDLAKTDERFARMLEDPYPKQPARPLLTDSVEVCVLGAGYGGLCCGARLAIAGVDPKDIRLVDPAGDVGGTWYWNRYPGAMCDVESYVYMPLCEELKYTPTEKYASQPEIYHHSQLIARTYGLYENALFGTRVSEMVWNEAKGMWSVKTSRGDHFHARYVVTNLGTFGDVKLPGIPGMDSFEGQMFHTSRWDYSYTGGSSKGDLHKLGDKRVAILGTGATAVQAVEHLAKASKHLYVFQRTPSAVGIRDNRKTDEEYARKFLSKPGWQKERRENFFNCTTHTDGSVDLVNDGWTEIFSAMNTAIPRIMQDANALAAKGTPRPQEEVMKDIQKAIPTLFFKSQERVRRRCDLVVDAPATANLLKPWYDTLCKRPCFHDYYLSSFNRPNVSLVDTDGRGVERVTPKGVVVDGVEYEVDCIVMATGFQPGGLSGGKRSSLSSDIVGRNGVHLQEKWSAPGHRYGPGPKTYRSYHSNGFPNLFILNGPQGVLSVNFVLGLDMAAEHAAHIVTEMKKNGYTKFDVKPEAEEKWLDVIWKMSPTSTGKKPTCTPGYYNDEGKVLPAGTKTLNGMANARTLWRDLAKERKEGTSLDAFNLE